MGDWRNLSNKQLHDQYSLPLTTRMINQGGWDSGVCSTFGKEGMCLQSFGRNSLKERDRLLDLGIDRKVMLWSMLKK